MPRLLPAILCLLGLLTAGPAAAGKYDWESWGSPGLALRDTAHKTWRFNVGLGGAYAPIYQGAAESELKPVPVIDVEYRDRIFVSTVRGVGFDLFRSRNVRAGPRLTVDYGRDSSDAPELSGLPNVATGVELGGYVEAYINSFRLKLDARQEVLDGHGGALGGADLAYATRWGHRAIFVLGANVRVMGDAYADAYFSSNRGAAPFKAGAGLRDAGGYFQAVHAFGQGFYLGLNLRGTLLLGSAAESPLSEEDFSAALTTLLGWRF